jgi:uncharacterized protein
MTDDTPTPEPAPAPQPRGLARAYRLRPFLVAAFAIAAVLAAVGGLQLRLDFTPQRIFESGDPDYTFLQRSQQVFGREDNRLVIHVRTTAQDKTLFDPESTAFLRELHRTLAEVEGVTGVDDLSSVQAVFPGSPFPQPVLPPEDSGLGQPFVERRAATHPLLAGRLLSQDLRSTLVAVRLDQDGMDLDTLAPRVGAVMKAFRGVAPPDGVEALATGIPLARVRVAESLMSDQLTFMPLCTLLFVAILWIFFRDLRAVIVPLAAVGCGLLYTLGLMGATGQDINIINNVLPVLVFVIGISDGIHLVARYRRELAAGQEQRQALWTTVRHLAFACLLTSVTTAVGFASLAVADISILQRFGLQSAMGVMIAYVVTVALVPLVFSYLSPILAASSLRADRLVDRWASNLVGGAARQRWKVAGLGAVFLALCVWQASGVKEENHLYESFSADDPIVVANDRVQQDFAGVVPVSLVIEWEQGTDVLTPDVLNYVADLAAFVDAQDKLGATVSVVDVVHEWNAARHLGDPKWRQVPATAAECRGAIEQTQRVLEAKGQAGLLGRVYAPEERMLRIAALAGDTGIESLQGTLSLLRERLADDAARQAELGLRVTLTGDGPVASKGIGGLLRDMIESLFLAFVIIFAVMWAELRSIRAALVAMIPNVFPLLVTLGFMGLVGIPLRIASVIVFTVALGLAVDDTIHFMVRLREEWRRLPPGHRSYQAAIERTGSGTGGAILVTSLVLASGFAVLLLSAFPVTTLFALCMEITVLAAIVGDLVLLPACLAIVHPLGPEDCAPAKPEPGDPPAT